jgi:outer membrane protein TolC
LFSSNPNASIGLSASLPIFDRERTAVAVERAEIGLSNQELSLQSTQKQVVLDVQRSYLDFTASVEQIRATTRQLEAARAALDAEQARYAVGVSTLFEVAQARTAFVQAQGNRIQAVYGAMLNRVAIDYNAGSIDAAAPLK